MDKRKQMGKDKKGVIFPIALSPSEMSDDYLQFEEAENELKFIILVLFLQIKHRKVMFWEIKDQFGGTH